MELDDWINREIAEGQASESGHFTVTLDAMLARMQLQGTGVCWWMARLVQAAVASGCTRLGVQGGNQLVFETETVWSAETIYEALTHPERPVERWLEHLRRGLWVCGWQDRQTWKFQLPGRELSFLDGKLTLQNRSGHGTSLRFRTRIDQSSVLVAAHPCPIEFCWNSRAIPGIGSIRSGMVATSQPGPLPILTVAAGEEHILYWVEDGVILESQPIWPERSETKLRVWGYADATGLPRDASGYGLVRTPEFKERSLQMQKSLARQLQELHPRSHRTSAPSMFEPLFSGAKAAGATWATGWMLGDPGLGTLVAFFAGALGMVYGCISVDVAQEAKVDDDGRVELLKLKNSFARWQADSGAMCTTR